MALKIKITTLLLLLMSIFAYSQSADIAKKNNQFPRVILLQINTEQNRIRALEKNKRDKEVEIVKKDAAIISSKMKADFKENFNYCPVYFFMDTNQAMIRSRNFDGFLMNVDGSIAKNILTDSSKDFLIVYYGYPTYQSNRTKVVKKSYEMDTSRLFIPYGKGLIINNYRMEQVSYLYKFGFDNFFYRLKKSNRKYIYESKKYDIEYLPFARNFNERLIEDNKNHIHITHYTQ